MAATSTSLLRKLAVGAPGGEGGKASAEAPPHRGSIPVAGGLRGTAEELVAYFSPREEVRRITILCAKFSGHPKGYS